jgi:hypothetical protein
MLVEKTCAGRSKCSLPFFLSHIKMSLSNLMPVTNNIKNILPSEELPRCSYTSLMNQDHIFRGNIVGMLISSKQQDDEISIMPLGSLNKFSPKANTK